MQVTEAGGDKAARSQATNAQQHAALVHEMYQIAESADADAMISGYSLNEYLEQLRDSHAQVQPPHLSIQIFYSCVRTTYTEQHS